MQPQPVALPLPDVVLAFALLGAALAAGVIGGVSLWVWRAKWMSDGHWPRPPWWYDRHGWDD
jgi:hypothetical protein